MLARYILKRILIGIVQLAGLAAQVFFLIPAAPADPVSRLVGYERQQGSLCPAAASWAWTSRF